MKVLLVSDINSAHTQKWAIALAKQGIEVGVFSFRAPIYNWFLENNIAVFYINNSSNHSEKLGSKILYLKQLPFLKKCIKKFKPDVLHAHYASSYGLLGVLASFHPLFVSFWGTDVFEFPKKSVVNRLVFSKILQKADVLFSTSNFMAIEAQHYTEKTINVIPFGIDTTLFKKLEEPNNNSNQLIIGTIKSLEEIYGIKYLINAFKLLKDKHPEIPLKLMLVGDGSQSAMLKKLVVDLGIESDVDFVGRVKHEETILYHNKIDIFVNVSLFESFGVSVLEASACEKPVIATKVGGLTEVVDDGITGILVPPKSIEEITLALEKLVLDKPLREQMGKAGRERTNKFFNLDNNTKLMISHYKSVSKDK
jgi:glycosyltransferase involved in cell wall biosynthesis